MMLKHLIMDLNSCAFEIKIAIINQLAVYCMHHF